jgi:trehalose/maltose transport system permease protein
MATTTSAATAQAIARQDADAIPYTHVHKRKWGYYFKRGLFWLFVAFILIYTIFPFYYAILSSLTPSSRLFDTPAVYFPEKIDWSHYEYVLRNNDFLKALMNSTIVSFSITILALTLGSFAAYALGRFSFRGRTAALYVILSMTMFPAVAIVGSLFSVIRGDWFLHTPNIYNTRTALVYTYFTFALPFTVWVLTNFFKAMPRELEEASLVDGATPMQTFWKILLPLAAPGLVTTGLLCFIAAWNEFLFALTFTQDYKSRTVQVAIEQFAGNQQFELPFAKRMAAAVVVTLPLIALVMIFQRKIIAGLTAGAVKG